MAKQRLDHALVSRGLCASREQAKRLILAGEVRVGDHTIDKAARMVGEGDEITVKERPRFVSRGGLKLEAALDAFAIEVAGRTCLDIGASTGGFTDCLLQRGARRVYAFDVGTNQLAWKLRSHPRVVSREQFNVRHMTAADLEEKTDFVAIDVSFISLTRILGPAFEVLGADGTVVCLIKPQFELAREDVGKGGIVRDAGLHQRAVRRIREFVTGELAKDWHGVIDSPITGTDGNREFLAWLSHRQNA